MAFRFGEFVLDADARQLRRGGKPIPLTPKLFALLMLLIDSRPRVLSKGDLMQRLWPDVIVEEANVRNLAAELRRALRDDDRNPRFIRTVHRVGYAFIADVVEDSPATQQTVAVLTGGDRTFFVPMGKTVLGRAADCAVYLDAHFVSRHHAAITIDAEDATIEDLGSKNGTWIKRPADRGAGRLAGRRHDPGRER